MIGADSDASMTKNVYLVGSVQYALCTRCVEEAKSDQQFVRHHLTLDSQVKCDNCDYRDRNSSVDENNA